MKIRYDSEVDAAYLALGDIADGEAVVQIPELYPPGGRGEIILDFDAQGHVIGMEILAASVVLRPEVLDKAVRI
ncbi:DUF2283 domain-containing protein [Microbacterium hydrocarbonoxydans]|uniref:DUF2283 domain-containing protein n=1 Tax=Microbacterium hydrocarbonoxydans TaxID=273678 RepID=UPI002040A90F|nr:DUF2283 domain-containing protein [Microbacterium hydrocarbonoxydans]MCM3780495.1 DUF2283 domain-containing protein [Microbacterium hydrocarbonoxydans]